MKFFWGILMLAAAAFLLLNPFNNFMDIGIINLILAVLSLAFLVNCIVRLRFAPIPIPIAVLYIVLQEPLKLPYIQIWTLLLAAVLAVIGLALLLPRKSKSCNCKTKDNVTNVRHETGSNDNNPVISVNCGAVSQFLQADSLETLKLDCHFGGMEIFFNNVKLSPGGAEVTIDCNVGGIKLLIPPNWRVINNVEYTMGGMDDKCFATPAEDAPQLTLKGKVLVGGIEIRYT